MSKGRAYSLECEDHFGLIHKFAKGGFARLSGAGVDIDYEDIFQEMCVIAVKAKTTFNPEFGNGFSAYLGRIMINNFNQYAARRIREQSGLGTLHMEDLGAEGCDFLEHYEHSNQPRVGHEMETMQEARALLSRLVDKPSSKRKRKGDCQQARDIIRDLIAPSRALIAHHEAALAHYHYGTKELGESVTRVPAELNLRYIAKYHGVPFYRFERTIKEKLGIEIS